MPACPFTENAIMKKHPLLSFFLITFGITWGLGALIMFFPAQFVSLFGELDLSKPFYKVYWHLAVYGPPIAAFTVIAATRGAAGIKGYARRLLHWRVGVRWFLIVLVGIPAVHACNRIIYSLLGGTAPAYEFDPWYLVIPSALIALVDDPGPMEELGWRGFALPLLQQRFSALTASVILGIIWGVWHLPAFFISATPQSALSLPFFLLNTVSYAIVMTAVYNGTRGSIPLAFLFHWQINNAFGLSIYPKGEWISALSYLSIAVIVVIILGAKNLGRAKHTGLLPAHEEIPPNEKVAHKSIAKGSP
jgi:membrane protease YdiL (CAAX protease family)